MDIASDLGSLDEFLNGPDQLSERPARRCATKSRSWGRLDAKVAFRMLTQLGCVPVVQLVDGLEYEVIHVFHDEQPVLFSKLERLGWKHEVEHHRAVIHVFQGRPRLTREQQDLKTKHLVAGAPVSPRDHLESDRCGSSTSDTAEATPIFRSASEQREICSRLAVPRASSQARAESCGAGADGDAGKAGPRDTGPRCPLPRPVKPSKPAAPVAVPREEKAAVPRHKSEERRVPSVVSATVDRLSKPRCRELPRADSLPSLDTALTAVLGMEPDARGPLKASKAEQQLIAQRLSRPRATPKAEPEEPVTEAKVRSKREQQAACERLSGVKPEQPASSHEDGGAAVNADSIVMVPFDFRVQPRVVEDVLSVPRGVFRIDEEVPARPAASGRSRPAGLPYASRRRPAQQRVPVAEKAAYSAPVVSEEVFSRIDSFFADVGRDPQRQEPEQATSDRTTGQSSPARESECDGRAEKAAGVELVEEVMWTALMLLKMGGCQSAASLVADWCEMVLPAAAARGWLPSRATRDRIAAVFPSLLVCLQPAPQPMHSEETMARLRACRDAFLLRVQQNKSGSASDGSTYAESRHSVSDSHDEDVEPEADGASAAAAGSSAETPAEAEAALHAAGRPSQPEPRREPQPGRVAERVPRKPRRSSLSFWTDDSLASIAPQGAGLCGSS
mmetsp:Transcript_33596/g.81245  ORF Transcript_33596/g.81245 Transcript_33596/m.81245 type:complete len:675 (-) Transcript_33596:14-2038(-)